MEVEKLFKFVERCLHNAEWMESRNDREAFFNQAFGAMLFVIESDEIAPDVARLITDAWEGEYRPQFEKAIWG